MKLTTFSSAKKTKKETKPIRDSESTLKVKVRSSWTVFKTLLVSAVFAFKKHFMEMRFFKSKNATKMTKPIIESSCKVLLDKISFIIIKRTVHFL